jgi:DNA-binding MarR family transcriptional regulator
MGSVDNFERACSRTMMAAVKAQWWRAMRWRIAVEAALAGSGLSFTQWLVLDAMRDLIAERDDAVNQSEVAARVALSRAQMSSVMQELERKWLVSRGPDLNGRAWRIWLLQPAEALLDEVAARIEGTSSRHADPTAAPPRLSPLPAEFSPT